LKELSSRAPIFRQRSQLSRRRTPVVALRQMFTLYSGNRAKLSSRVRSSTASMPVRRS
jgi:hypothetical protein